MFQGQCTCGLDEGSEAVTLEVDSGRPGSTCQAGSCALAGYSILGWAGGHGLQPTSWSG